MIEMKSDREKLSELIADMDLPRNVRWLDRNMFIRNGNHTEIEWSKRMRVIVCGGRNFNNDEWVNSNLDKLGITEVATGGAKGVDRLAEQWAKSRKLRLTIFPALWDTYGRIAGQIRNKQMLDEFKPDAVVAFTTGCGPGTNGMIELSIKSGTKTIVIDGSGVVVDNSVVVNNGVVDNSVNDLCKLFQQ